MLISQFKLLRESKFYNILKLLFKLIIYFNLFMLSTDFILKYESDEIYTIFLNIYNNIKNISYFNLNDILNYLKNKFYLINKVEDLIKDNSIEDNSIDKSSNNDSNNDSNNINNYTFYIIFGIVIISSIVVYIYYNNENNTMNDLLKDLSHLKYINQINDNDSLIDMNLDNSPYFSNITPTNYFLKPVKRTSSIDSNKTIK